MSHETYGSNWQRLPVVIVLKELEVHKKTKQMKVFGLVWRRLG